MQNEVLWEKEASILNSIYHGDQTADTINEIAEAVKPMIAEMRANKKKVLILINLADIHNQTAAARKAALDQIDDLDYDKIAIYGANIFIKKVVEFLIASAGKREKVQYFNTEEEARKWLLE